jgi:hypothetical protein
MKRRRTKQLGAAATALAMLIATGAGCSGETLVDSGDGDFVGGGNSATNGGPGGPSEPPPDLQPRPNPPAGPDIAGEPNTLDQDRLFTCVPEETTYTASRVWRLSGDQFMRSSWDLSGSSNHNGVNPFAGASSGRRFTNVAGAFAITEEELDAIFRAGRSTGWHAVRDNKAPQCMRNIVQAIVRDGEPEPADPLSVYDENCRRSVASWGLEKLLRRAPTEDEVTRYAERFAEVASELGVERGVYASVTLMMTHPEFLFRPEFGEPVPGASYNSLTDDELANALALTLTNRTADRLDYSGISSDEAVLDATVDSLIDESDRHGYRAVMHDFLEQYLKSYLLSSVFKDNRGPGWKNGFMPPFRHLLTHLVVQDTDFVNSMLTTTVVFDGASRFEDATRLEDDPTRPGVLSRRAWLGAFSLNDSTDPIHRGLFIRESLMCQKIPDVPIGVVPQLPPQTEDTTMRDRLAAHNEQASCKGCHDLMDPLGLPFERFDQYADWREMEAGRPVDTSGEIINFGSANGPVADHVELVQRLGESDDVERCVIRHLFRYMVGRDETYGDACTLAAAHEAYEASNGSLKATIKSIATSDTFRYRNAQAGE